jgi:enamine deaminase RidA (YjgF/YER057c/UK114 family)
MSSLRPAASVSDQFDITAHRPAKHHPHPALRRANKPPRVRVSRFHASSGVREFHLTISPAAYADFPSQLAQLEQAYFTALADHGLDPSTALLRRFFCSDLANQSALLDSRPFSRVGNPDTPCAISRICMPPMPPAKVALWAYHVSDPTGPLIKHLEENTLIWSRGQLSHLWTTGLSNSKLPSSHAQTSATLARYSSLLQSRGLSWSANVLRTWLFVRDIEANYDGVVKARREIFQRHNLTPQTHFIASTGIQGSATDPATLLTMDAYALAGAQKQQISFLAAPDHLTPACLYGVTFERGTAVDYQDRRHILISGTASIDPSGAIVHPGSVLKQLNRAIENVAALLHAAGATLADMNILIAYVRDPADQRIVAKHLRTRLNSIPFEVFVAPICRPGWLVEIEAMAAVPVNRLELPKF